MAELILDNMPNTHHSSVNCTSLLDHAVMQRFAVFTKAQRFRRLTLVLVLLGICFLILLVKTIGSFVAEGRSAWAALNREPVAETNFQASKHPESPDLIHVKNLDPAVLPRSSKNAAGTESQKKRLVFVGDIHGCRRELDALLKKVRFHVSTDHLVAVGDVVSKGRDSLGVVDLLRRYGASCVRGKHDDRLLLVAQSLRSGNFKASERAKSKNDSNSNAGVDPVQHMAMSPSNDQFEYIQSCPVILRLGELKAFNGEAVVVHAGLVPGVALESQDPVAAMNMRIIDLPTHFPSKRHESNGSIAWYKLWNRYQQLLSLHERLGKPNKEQRVTEKHTTVIYGHNAKDGLQIHKYTKGLDTSCVIGGKLTALVVDGNGKQEIVQVKAQNHGDRPALQVDVLRDGGPESGPDAKAD